PSELDVWTDHHVAKAGQAFLEVWHEGTDRQDHAVDAAGPALLDASARLDGGAGQQVGTSGNHLDGCRIAAGIRRGAARHIEQRKGINLGADGWEEAVAQAAGAACGRFGMTADDDGNAADRFGIATHFLETDELARESCTVL